MRAPSTGFPAESSAWANKRMVSPAIMLGFAGVTMSRATGEAASGGLAGVLGVWGC
jgi:hypothetical protein